MTLSLIQWQAEALSPMYAFSLNVNARPLILHRGIIDNADWRNFESTPAAEEKSDKSITIFDYHRLLTKTGWKTTHRIECPLSSERLTGNQVKRMQDKRILGTIGRTLLIAKKIGVFTY